MNEPSLEPFERAQLREFLVDRFSLDELELLGFDLGVDYELFNYKNKPRLAQELIAYFERRDKLACLITEIIRQRPNENLADLLAKLPFCMPNTKVQVFVKGPKAVADDINQFLEQLRHKYGLQDEDVAFVAGADGSLHLLLAVSELVSEVLLIDQGNDFSWKDIESATAVKFVDLPARDKKIWQMVALEWPVHLVQDNLLPAISWQKAADLYTMREQIEALHILIGGGDYGSQGLRQPLTILITYTLLLDRIYKLNKEENEKERKFLDVILNTVTDLTDRINALYSVINSRVELIDPKSVILEVVNEMVYVAKSQDTEIVLDISPQIHAENVKIQADRWLLKSSLTALLSNGLKYSPGNGSIVVELAVENHEVIFSVRDQGIGIDLEFLPRLFEPYFRLVPEDLPQQSPSGSGLGLYITKLAAERSGGRVWVETAVGNGSVFYLAYPLAINA